MIQYISSLWATLNWEIIGSGNGLLPSQCQTFNTLSPRQNGRHFQDDNFKCIFFNKNVWIAIKIPLKFVTKGLINNIAALVQIIA